jgi:hypothetical protein
MNDTMRILADDEIKEVAGGLPILVSVLSACIEYTLHATDKGGAQQAETGDTGGGDTGGSASEDNADSGDTGGK